MKTILFGIAIITLKVSKYHKCNDSHQIYLPLVCNFCLSAYIAAQLKGRCIGCLILFKTSPTLHFHISYSFKQRNDDIDEEEKAISSLLSTCDIPFNTLGVEMCVCKEDLYFPGKANITTAAWKNYLNVVITIIPIAPLSVSDTNTLGVYIKFE